MAFKFIKLSEVKTETICAVIYGAPNVGKTTLALTSSKPVLIDFDEGSQRAAFVDDPAVVVCRRWSDLAGMEEDDLKPFDTIVIDTVGAALTKLAADLMRRDPSLGRNGALILPGWGRLGNDFRAFLDRMRGYGKDVILIAHMKEQENEGRITERIVAAGQSRDEIYQRADIMGRIVIRADLDRDDTQRWLSFKFTTAAYAKNVGLKDYPLPLPSEDGSTMARIISDAKDAMNGQAKERREVESLKRSIREAKTPEDFTGVAHALRAANAPLPPKRDLMDRAKSAGYRWDADDEAFVDPNAAAAESKSEVPF